MQSTF